LTNKGGNREARSREYIRIFGEKRIYSEDVLKKIFFEINETLKDYLNKETNLNLRSKYEEIKKEFEEKYNERKNFIFHMEQELFS